jgi:pantothenate kinase
MDGFHLPDAVLAERGLLTVKGAPATIDAEGFAALLARIRGTDDVVLAPAYSRELHAVVPEAVTVPAGARVIVEGNYLGLWPTVREQLDALWRLDMPWQVARERLIERRISTGRGPLAAAEWVDTVDAANHATVADTFADVVIRPGDPLPATPWSRSS